MMGSPSLDVFEIQSDMMYMRLGVFLYRDGSRVREGVG